MGQDAKAFICGCKGFELDAAERAFMGEHRPWGLILFKRNVESPDQLRRLTASFREIVGRADAPVLIDQEGGRVQRMGPPHWPAYPAAARFGALPLPLAERAEAVKLNARIMAADLKEVGITVDCLPVLDVPAPGSHAIVGDRAYGADPETVAVLGRAVCEGMIEGGVLPVVKHIPGHGRAKADSHLELPRVQALRKDLEAIDFAPFKSLRDAPLGMTAHVVYEAIDDQRPGTISPRIIQEIVRAYIGFDGLLMSDDLSMKALQGSFAERAAAVFAAGVDLALHCNGDLSEGMPVAEASPWLAGKSLERAKRALALLEKPVEPLDLVDARRKIHLMLAAAT